MRTFTGDYATIYYPDEFIYSQDVCNVYCKQIAGTVERYALTLSYESLTPSVHYDSVGVRLTPDADGNAFVDIAPYNRAMITECAGTLARLRLSIIITVYEENDSETLGLQDITVEPGTGRIQYTSDLAGEAVQPPVQVPVMSNALELLFDLQSVSGDAALQGNQGGVWYDYWQIVQTTGIDPQIKRLAIGSILPSFAGMQMRVMNHDSEIVWQGHVFNVNEACSADKWAFVRWRSDQWLRVKSWVFKIKQVTRKVTSSQDIALQPFAYTNEVNERNGQGVIRAKNWQVQMQLVVDGLTERELMYFNDLFTSPEVYVKSEALGAYGSTYLNLVQAAVDGSSISTVFKAERGSVTFTLLIADFKTF